jgi:hypothetical protein
MCVFGGSFEVIVMLYEVWARGMIPYHLVAELQKGCSPGDGRRADERLSKPEIVHTYIHIYIYIHVYIYIYIYIHINIMKMMFRR